MVEFSTGRLHSRYPWSGGKSGGHASVIELSGASDDAAVVVFCAEEENFPFGGIDSLF